MYNKETWFSIKTMKSYGQNFNGNGYTGGKNALALKITNKITWAGRALGAYDAYSIQGQYASGNMSLGQMIPEQGVNAYSVFGGLYGAAASIGWESGRFITTRSWYQNWKQEKWFPWREKHFGY